VQNWGGGPIFHSALNCGKVCPEAFDGARCRNLGIWVSRRAVAEAFPRIRLEKLHADTPGGVGLAFPGSFAGNGAKLNVVGDFNREAHWKGLSLP
ncbi:MAG: hypothetical protein WBK67_04085, partial [Minisyncoccales bacterium]